VSVTRPYRKGSLVSRFRMWNEADLSESLTGMLG